MHAKRTRYIFAAGAVILLAALVRCHSLDRESLWMDEAWSVWAAGQGTAADTVRAAVDDVHPPFYFVLLKGWTALAGDSEFAGRALSVFAGLLAIAFIYRAAREMFSPGAGAMAALAAAVSSYQVYYARELRMYTLVAMLGAAAVFFYQRWLRGAGRGSALGYWASVTLLLYTHYFGAFVPLVLALHYLLVLPAKWRKLYHWALIHLGIVTAFLPWAPVALQQIVARPGGLDQATPTSPELLRYLADVFTDAQPVLYAGLFTAAVLGARSMQRNKDTHPRDAAASPLAWTALLALWAIVPLGVTLAVNIDKPVFTVQNVLVAAPPAAMLAGVGLGRMRGAVRLAFAGVVVIAGLGADFDLYQDKPDWRGFVGELAERFEPGDAVFMHVGGPPLWTMPFEYYFARALPDAAPPVDMFELQGPPSAQVFAEALSDRVSDGHAWVWFTHTTPVTDYALPLLQQMGTDQLRAPELAAEMGDHRLYRYVPADDAGRAGFYFGHAFHLTGYEIAPGPYAPGDVIDVTLMWEVTAPPEDDYSMGVYLLSEGAGPAADHLGFPGGAFTSGWQPGDTYTDAHQISLPPDLPPGYYNVTVRVVNVFAADAAPLPVTDPLGVPLGEYVVLGGVVLEAP
jgi:hypothetical protein